MYPLLLLLITDGLVLLIACANHATMANMPIQRKRSRPCQASVVVSSGSIMNAFLQARAAVQAVAAFADLPQNAGPEIEAYPVTSLAAAVRLSYFFEPIE